MKYLALLLLTACATPQERCYQYGVQVEPGAPVTGSIIEERQGTAEQVKARCGKPFDTCYGCAIALAPGRYRIWYTDDYSREHERCHALYEENHHTERAAL